MFHVNMSLKSLAMLLIPTLFFAPAAFSVELDYGTGSRLTAAAPISCNQPNNGVREYNALIGKTRNEQPDLAEALRLFPKGADIHNHLSGSISPESYIAMGVGEGACFGPDSKVPEMYTLAAVSPDGRCGSGFKPLAVAGEKERTRIMQSLSMYQFAYSDIQKGHDQFFATFGRFGALSGVSCNTGPMLAKLLQQSNRDNVSYVETMLSFQSQAVSTLARLLQQKNPDDGTYRSSANYPALYRDLIDSGLKDAVAGAQNDISQYVARTSALLRCAAADRDPACGVSYGFQSSVNRNSAKKDGTPDLAKIFTQTAFSMLLAATDSRVVGVNLLSGEDGANSMMSFDTQMQIFSYFHTLFPGVNIALHAGELTPCFIGANNPALKDHLTGSLKAGAKRIGHGVSFAFLGDSDKAEVAGLMKQNDALVEIMFTSNAQILGVAGDDHPFMQYARYGVPMAFSTDDEGVSYANYTDEWIYAFMKYGLSGDDLQRLGRESLQHSFIPGAPLWLDLRAGKTVGQCAGVTPGIPDPPDKCREFLGASARAKAQWDYEARLTGYWQSHGKKYGRFLQRK